MAKMGTMVVTLMLIITCCSYAAAAAAKAGQVCSRPAEIVFLVDTSRSIYEPDFYRQLRFVKDMIGQFDVAPDKTRVAVVSFSNGYREEFKLDSYDTAEAMQKRVGEITFTMGDTTDTSDGIRYARENILSQSRPDVARIIICITDGKSTEKAKTVAQANKTREAGILVFAVGVGSRLDYKELGQIATQNTKKFVHTVQNFKLLSTIKDVLAYQACHATAAPTTPTSTTERPQKDATDATKACGGKPADIVFVLDRSSSVYILDFQALLETVKDIVRVMDIAPNKTQIAAVSYSTNASVEFFLNEFSTKSNIVGRIGKIQYSGGSTETGQALNMVRDTVLSPEHGGRGSSVARVVIVVTDGQSQDTNFTKSAAALLKKDGIYMFAIGVGDKTDPQELEDIASKPHKDFVFEVDSYGALESIQYLLAVKACDTKN